MVGGQARIFMSIISPKVAGAHYRLEGDRYRSDVAANALFSLGSRCEPPRQYLGNGLETKFTRQVTRFTNYDIDMPSIGRAESASSRR